VLDDRAPEDQHIDPGIGAAGGGIRRHGDRRFRSGRSPGLDPGHAAGLQLGDNLVGDVVVKARPVGPGASVAAMSGHRGSPRRAPEASPPALNPSRQTRSALSLSLWGRCGVSPLEGVGPRPRLGRRGRPSPPGHAMRADRQLLGWIGYAGLVPSHGPAGRRSDESPLG
jgi:hypothetical protein